MSFKGKNQHDPKLLEGRFSASEKGFGFFIPDDGSRDLFIPPKDNGGAWHGDRVLVMPMGDPDGRGPTGRVETVLQRTNVEVTGRLERHRKSAWVEPDDRRLPPKIDIPRVSLSPNHQNGDKVGLRMTSYGDRKPPVGEVTTVLGRDGTFGAAVEAILHVQGVRRRFGQRVNAAARSMPRSVSEADLVGRLDLRDQLIFTIDGAEAKDLDDAISLATDDKGRRVLGVHIADVSHYVQTDSPLDGEAWARGTSVYFADQVVPMLPQELSNGICSLHGGVDRLCLSCFMTLDEDGSTLESELRCTVIHSKARMTYKDCNAILAGDTAVAVQYAEVAAILPEMNDLAKRMTKLRSSKGALEIETVESQIICNHEGLPVELKARERGDSEKLIEAFMLAANEAVASLLTWAEAGCVYRVHQDPNPDKLETFYALALSKGLTFKKAKTVSSGVLQSILHQTNGLPCKRVMHNALLRSLMKARYSIQNTGHFGLASACYCHFTSPIRRYPDLLVHRCVKAYLGQAAQPASFYERLAESALQSSTREVAADTTSRQAEKLYKALYMQPFIGQTFEGLISGVQTFGFYVELATTVEGLVSVHSLQGDFFEVDELGLMMKGVNSGRKYEVGDAVTVLCVGSDPLSGRIDFTLTNPVGQ